METVLLVGSIILCLLIIVALFNFWAKQNVKDLPLEEWKKHFHEEFGRVEEPAHLKQFCKNKPELREVPRNVEC